MVDAPLRSVAARAQSEQPRSPSLTERRMERTRRQLAEMAARLFLERGYEAVTVEEIVAAVEVSRGRFSGTSHPRRTYWTKSSSMRPKR